MQIDHIIKSSRGWKRRCVAFGGGAFGALALAPLNILPALCPTFVVAIWLLDGAATKPTQSLRPRGVLAHLGEAFGIGWWLGFGYFVAGLWWLGAAFLVDAEEFAWALPLGVAGLPAVLACFTGLGTALARCFWSPASARVLVFGLSLASTEWMRSAAFTGFPWNSFGMALGNHLVLAQSASLVGLHGLTLLAVLILASPATLIDPGRLAHRIASPCLGAVALAILFGFGAWRLSEHPTTFEALAKIRIVQPNVAQDENFRAERSGEILADYIRVSRQPTSRYPAGIANVTHVIWPESAFPFFLARDPAALATIAQGLGAATLVTGAARMETTGGDGLPGEIRRVSYFNAVQVVGEGGRILDSYDKVHLVPFGEYLPLTGLLESLGLRQFVHIPGGFESGSVRKLIEVPGLPGVFPLVCYEAIFPGVLDPDLRRDAGLILNVSNDGWFGVTSGPHQHLAQARLRTIEEGLPMLRAANTGMSAVVDPYGRLIDHLPLGIEGVLDVDLPRPADAPPYARAPMLAPLGLFLLVFGALLVLRGQRPERGQFYA